MTRSNSITKKFVIIILTFFFYLILLTPALFAFEQTITVPAESSRGIELDFRKGNYIVKIEGGAAALFYPINPNYRWLIGVAIGTNMEGGQDYPNIGTLYFEPDPPAYTQAKAEEQVMQAVNENIPGTFLKFNLTENKKVRFWVSDFDYTDNSGMIKITIKTVE